MKTSIIKLASVSALLLFPVAAIAAERPEDKMLRQFEQLIQGEFDNYNQVNFETNSFLSAADKPVEKDRHARLYKRIVKIEAPEIGNHVYFEQTHSGGRDKAIYRQVVIAVKPDYENNSLVATNYKFNDAGSFESLWSNPDKQVTKADLRVLSAGCETVYQQVGDTFVGEVNKATCKVPSKHGGFVNIYSYSAISPQGYWSTEAGFNSDGKMLFGKLKNDPFKLTRAYRFKCWAAFETDKLKDNGEPHWDFFPGLSLHNQGDIVEFTTSHKEPQKYFFRLKETIFPAGKRPDVLELFIHENSEEAKRNYTKSLSYTWTNADASRLGINLRWMQSSCSRVKGI